MIYWYLNGIYNDTIRFDRDSMGHISGMYLLVICDSLLLGGQIVDLARKDGDFPVRYVSLPEGSYLNLIQTIG